LVGKKIECMKLLYPHHTIWWRSRCTIRPSQSWYPENYYWGIYYEGMVLQVDFFEFKLEIPIV